MLDESEGGDGFEIIEIFKNLQNVLHNFCGVRIECSSMEKEYTYNIGHG